MDELTRRMATCEIVTPHSSHSTTMCENEFIFGSSETDAEIDALLSFTLKKHVSTVFVSPDPPPPSPSMS